jgi:hypothetical protein
MVIKKYNANSGWFKESSRHSLARRGIKTGTKLNYASMPMKKGGMPVSIQSLSGNDEQKFDVGYGGTSVGIKKLPTDKELMQDADEIVAEYDSDNIENSDDEDSDNEIKIPQKFISNDDTISVVDKDLSDLESASEPFIGSSWSDKLKDGLKNLIAKGVQSYKDLDVSGINDHLAEIKENEIDLNDRINVLRGLKSKIQSAKFRDKAGVKLQIDELKRVNALLAVPNKLLANVKTVREDLETRKKRIISNESRLRKNDDRMNNGKKGVDKDSFGYIMTHLDESIDSIKKPKRK